MNVAVPASNADKVAEIEYVLCRQGVNCTQVMLCTGQGKVLITEISAYAIKFTNDPGGEFIIDQGKRGYASLRAPVDGSSPPVVIEPKDQAQAQLLYEQNLEMALSCARVQPQPFLQEQLRPRTTI